jgi:Amt family ammonium transporter
MAFLLGKLVDKTIGFRISAEDEVTGVDLTTHAESAYELTSLGGAGGYAPARTPASSQERVDA